MTRLSTDRLLALDASLTARRRLLVQLVWRLRLANGGQLRWLVSPRASDYTPALARALRRDLDALTTTACLHRLNRRIGGVRAGSAGFVYALGPVGRRLVDLWAGEGAAPPRSSYEPTVGFVDHALAVSEAIVVVHRAATAAKRGLTFEVEQNAWRPYHGPHGEQLRLKPDAELILEDGDFADHWWLEIDQATERRSVLERKLRAYATYEATGLEQRGHGVFPLVAWLTTSEARAAVIREEIGALPQRAQALFRVGLQQEAATLLVGSGAAS